jgi:hypothetical protein
VSPRARVRLIVGASALVAAAVVVGVALNGRGDGSPERKPPVLELSVLVGDDSEAQALRAAERAYDGGRVEAARAQFETILRSDPASVEAAVGAAIASWPDGTLDELRRLAGVHPGSALVHLHLGLALYAAGEQAEATAEWRRAAQVEPDSPSAVRAGDLLHPEMAPGLPSFFTDLKPPKDLATLTAQKQLDELERNAKDGGGADEWLLYGAALQRVGRPPRARPSTGRSRLRRSVSTLRSPRRSAASTRRIRPLRSPGWGPLPATIPTRQSSGSTSASFSSGSRTSRTREYSSSEQPLPCLKVSTGGKQNRSFPVLKALGPNV